MTPNRPSNRTAMMQRRFWKTRKPEGGGREEEEEEGDQEEEEEKGGNAIGHPVPMGHQVQKIAFRAHQLEEPRTVQQIGEGRREEREKGGKEEKEQGGKEEKEK